jgi:hypothetical protein
LGLIFSGISIHAFSELRIVSTIILFISDDPDDPDDPEDPDDPDPKPPLTVLCAFVSYVIIFGSTAVDTVEDPPEFSFNNSSNTKKSFLFLSDILDLLFILFILVVEGDRPYISILTKLFRISSL